MFLKISQNSQENTCARASFNNFIKRETLAEVFSCKFCEILKNTFFIEHPRWLLLDIFSKYSERMFFKIASDDSLLRPLSNYFHEAPLFGEARTRNLLKMIMYFTQHGTLPLFMRTFHANLENVSRKHLWK